MKGTGGGDVHVTAAQQRGKVIGQRIGGPLWIITMILVAAKAFGFATYSWWLATSPIWGLLAVLGVVYILAALVVGLASFFEK